MNTCVISLHGVLTILLTHNECSVNVSDDDIHSKVMKKLRI